MPKLETYDRSLSYSYAPGIFPSMECLHACPERCLRLLVSSAGESSEGVRRLVQESEAAGIRVETADPAARPITACCATPSWWKPSLRMRGWILGTR